MTTFEQRFWAKVQKTDGCWLWTAYKDQDGYGRIWRNGTAAKAQRMSWEIHSGAIPDGLCALHHCDVPACVKPEHLFLGTRRDNNADRDTKGRQVHNKGEAHAQAKLTAVQVLDMRSRRGQTQRSLAKEFGVSRAHIRGIRSGKSWAHLQEAA